MPYTVKEKTCANCGEKFFASKPRVKTCSQSCGAKDRCKRGLFSNKPKPIKWVENWKPALKANLDSPCHECTSHARNEEGYIYVMRNHKPIGLHRFLYEERNGKIPKGLVVRHRCDNPSCINPDHAILGTHADNTKDKVMRFRVYRPTGRKNPNAKITEAQVKKIFLDKELSNSVLADRYNLTRSTIHRIKKGVIWKSVTSKIAILLFLLFASVASAQWNKDLYDYGTKSNDTVYLAGTSFQHYFNDGDTAFCHVFGYPVSDSEEFAYCIYKSSPNIFIINSVVYNYYGTTAAVSFPSVSGVVSVTVEYKYNYPELIQLEIGGSSGTVTSVGLSLPGIFSVTGSPVTTSGTLTATLASQTANKVWASPNGSTGAPTFRVLVATDIPSLSYEPVITAGTTGQYWRGDKSWQTLNAAAVGLGNVTNNLQLTAANNLSDLVNTTTARTNLGLGSSATHASSDYFLVANNLSEGTATTMRTNLGLGTSAVQNVSYFLQTANNLSDVTASTARTNLGLGTSATHPATDFAASGANTDITSVLLNQTGLVVKGGDANALTIKPNETMTAARTLNLKINDVSRTIDLSGNLTVSGAATISGTNTGDQDLSGYVPTSRTVNGHALSSNVTVTAGDLSLGSVENTALSTWTGTTNITTLGTIATGVWHGTAIANANLANSAVANLSGTNTGDQTITLGTDLSGSGTSTLNATIVSGAVTLAKMANMATSSLIYRRTAGSGVPEVNTLAQLKTDLTLVKADVGLGSVENTALSTWAGSTNITSVGTLASPTLTTPVINGLATGTGIASAATASTIVTRDASANVTANNWIGGYRTTATAAATTTLTVTDTYLQYFTGSTTQTVALPAVSTLALGHQFVIVNNSSGAVTVNSSGGNAVIILAGSTSAIVTSIATSGTDQTVWSVSYAADNVTTAKKLSVSNTLTLAGTDGTTMTFPSTSATIARTDAANTFTGVQTMTSPNFTTPVLGTPTSGNLANCTGYVGTTALITLGAVTTGTWSATAIGETKGGTNQTTYTLGDMLYSSASNTLSKLAGNTTGTKNFLVQTGTGTVSAAPSWATIAVADVPTLNQNTTGSAAKWTTARTINGLSVDGSANVSGNFTAGGTGSGFTVDLANSTMSGVLPIVNGGELRNTAATSATTGTMTVTMNTRYVTITPTGACTFNASGGVQGQTTTFFISTSGTSSFTLTWGTNFKTTGTLATGTTTAKQFLVTFTCVNGTQWNEMARTTAE